MVSEAGDLVTMAAGVLSAALVVVEALEVLIKCLYVFLISLALLHYNVF